MRVRHFALGGFISSIWFFWLVYIVVDPTLSGQLTGGESPYTTLGAFGDSFGVIASFMTMVAAIAVYVTLDNEIQDRKTKDFDSKFYTLLGTFVSTTEQTRMPLSRRDKDAKYKATYEKLYKSGSSRIIREFSGREAIKIILYLVRDKISPSGYKDIKIVSRAYQQIFDRHVDQLGHYFRQFYHLLKLISDAPSIDKMYYVRVLRAQLSDPELRLIAYNCVVGEGRHKLRYLVEDFAILHNLHREGLDDYAKEEITFFIRKLSVDAFRFDPLIPITYDD